MVAIAQNERARINILGVFIGSNTTFHRKNFGRLGVHSIGDTTVTFTEFSPNAIILKGHSINVDGIVHTVAADGSSDASGVVTDLAVLPPLTQNIVVGRVRIEILLTFYFSELPFSTKSGDDPADQIFEPFLEVTKGFKSTLAAGDSFGQGFEVDAGEVTIVARELFGGEKFVQRLEPYAFSGRPAALHLVGQIDGTELDWSTKLTLVDGVTGQMPKWTARTLTLPVRAEGLGLTNEWQRRFRGYAECPFFPLDASPASVATVAAAQWEPGSSSFTILQRIWVPEGGAGTGRTFDKEDSVIITSDPAGWVFTVEKTDSTFDAVSTVGLFEFRFGQWYDIAAVWDRDEDELRIYVDGVLIDEDSITAPFDVIDTTAKDLLFGSTLFVGQIAETALFDAPLSDFQIQTIQQSPIPDPPNFADLLAYWPGLMNAGITALFEIGPDFDPTASPTSPWEATLSGGVIKGHTLEGNSTGRGLMVPKAYGFVRNATPYPLDPARNIFLYHDSTSQIPTSLYDRGAELDFDADLQLQEFYENPPGAPNQWTSCSQYGLIRIRSLLDNAQITVDYVGRGGSDGSYRIQFVNSEFIEWDNAPTVFNSSWSVLFWYTLDDDILENQTILSNRSATQGWHLRHINPTNTSQILEFLVSTTNTTSVDVIAGGLRNQEPHHIALVVDESGGDVNITLYVDGILANTASVIGETLENAVDELRFGSEPTASPGSGSNFSGGAIAELSFHSAALTQATIRDIMFRRSMLPDITAGPTAPTYAPDLAHYYGFNPREPGVAVDESTLIDQFGSEDATVGNTPGIWNGAVGIGSTLHALHDLLTVSGDVDHDDIDFTLAFEPSLVTQMIGVEPQEIVSVAEMIEIVKAGAAAQIPYHAPTTTWHPSITKDPDDLTPVATILEADCADPIKFLASEIPPVLIQVRWGLQYTVQDAGDLVVAVDDDHRTFVARAERFAQEFDAANAKIYPSHAIAITVDGIWFNEEDAAAEAVRQMDIRGRKIPVPRYIEIRINRSFIGDDAVRVGTVITLIHSDLPDATSTRILLILTMETKGKDATLRCWG